MIFVVIFLVMLCGALAYFLTYSLLRNLELLDQLDDIEERIDDCVAVIVRCHEKVETKSKMEVFFDDPIVKELVSDLKEARDALGEVSQVLTQMTREDAEDADDTKEEK